MAGVTTEGKKNTINLIQWIPYFLTLATILAGVYQYNRTVERETRKEFFYKQVANYEKITDQVSVMIYSESNSIDSLRLLLTNYQRMRHGQFSLYTTDSVEKYANSFEYYYERYLMNDSVSKEDLERLSFKLYNQCRNSLNQTLDVDLKTIQFRNNLN